MNLLDSKEARILWIKADDGIRRDMLLSEIYNNVPEELANVTVDVMELHSIKCDPKLKKKVLKWLWGSVND